MKTTPSSGFTAIQTLEGGDGSDYVYHTCSFAHRAGQEAGADNN
jgi:hypothetical protein